MRQRRRCPIAQQPRPTLTPPLGHVWDAAALMGKHVAAEEDGGGASAGRRMAMGNGAGAGSRQGGPEGHEHDLNEINSDGYIGLSELYRH